MSFPHILFSSFASFCLFSAENSLYIQETSTMMNILVATISHPSVSVPCLFIGYIKELFKKLM